jgi:hypothetical protein
MTLVIFYAMSWYSLNTLPTSAVFQRILLSIGALMVVMFVLLALAKKQKKLQ